MERKKSKIKPVQIPIEPPKLTPFNSMLWYDCMVVEQSTEGPKLIDPKNIVIK